MPGYLPKECQIIQYLPASPKNTKSYNTCLHPKEYQIIQCLPTSPKNTKSYNICLPPQRIPNNTIPVCLPKEYQIIQYLPASPKNTKSYNICLPPQRIPNHTIPAYLPKEYQIIQYLPTSPKNTKSHNACLLLPFGSDTGLIPMGSGGTSLCHPCKNTSRMTQTSKTPERVSKLWDRVTPSVADPGFLRGGGANSPGGGQHMIFPRAP